MAHFTWKYICLESMKQTKVEKKLKEKIPDKLKVEMAHFTWFHT